MGLSQLLPSGLIQPKPEAIEPLCHLLSQNSDMCLAPQEASEPAYSAVDSLASVGNKTRGTFGECVNERAVLGSLSPAVAGFWLPLCHNPTCRYIEILLIDQAMVHLPQGSVLFSLISD